MIEETKKSPEWNQIAPWNSRIDAIENSDGAASRLEASVKDIHSGENVQEAPKSFGLDASLTGTYPPPKAPKRRALDASLTGTYPPPKAPKRRALDVSLTGIRPVPGRERSDADLSYTE